MYLSGFLSSPPVDCLLIFVFFFTPSPALLSVLCFDQFCVLMMHSWGHTLFHHTINSFFPPFYSNLKKWRLTKCRNQWVKKLLSHLDLLITIFDHFLKLGLWGLHYSIRIWGHNWSSENYWEICFLKQQDWKSYFNNMSVPRIFFITLSDYLPILYPPYSRISS